MTLTLCITHNTSSPRGCAMPVTSSRRRRPHPGSVRSAVTPAEPVRDLRRGLHEQRRRPRRRRSSVSRKVGPETLIEAITSPCALRIGAADRGEADLELVDGQGVALLADLGELLAQLRLLGDGQRACTPAASPAGRRAASSVEAAEQHLAVGWWRAAGCAGRPSCAAAARRSRRSGRGRAPTVSESTAMLTVSPVSAASLRQIGRASCTTSSRARRGTGQPEQAHAQAVLAAVLGLLDEPRALEGRDQPERGALVDAELGGDLGDPGLAGAGQHLHDRHRPVDRLDPVAAPASPSGLRAVAHGRDTSAGRVAYRRLSFVSATVRAPDPRPQVLPTSPVEQRDAPAGDSCSSSPARTGPASCTRCRGFLVQHGGNILESQQFGDQLTDRFFMRIDFATVPRTPATPTSCATASRRSPREFGMDVRAVGRGGAVPDADHGLQAPALPQRPAVPGEHGSLQIEIPAIVSNHPDAEPLVRLVRHRVPPHPGDAGHQAGGRGSSCWSWSTTSASTWSCWPATCRCSPTTCAKRLVGPRDQHPPLVPAELQGRQALPPGLRPRGEAGRRDRPLRHRRPRRGPDHRAGRDARRPLLRPGPAGLRRPRRRGAGAVPRRALALESRVLLNGTGPSSSADQASSGEASKGPQTFSMSRRRLITRWSLLSLPVS